MMIYDAVLACYAAIYFQVITNTFVLQFQILRKLQEALFLPPSFSPDTLYEKGQDHDTFPAAPDRL